MYKLFSPFLSLKKLLGEEVAERSYLDACVFMFSSVSLHDVK
jgi:hypothetical protein